MNIGDLVETSVGRSKIKKGRLGIIIRITNTFGNGGEIYTVKFGCHSNGIYEARDLVLISEK
tara:strand:- start:7164 stop:7349 length:186 start_codon:yes stop_codon:yes gene_type:complete